MGPENAVTFLNHVEPHPASMSIGAYSNGEDAVKNAKVYFSRMNLYELLYTEEQDKRVEKVDKMGRHRGVFTKFNWEDG